MTIDTWVTIAATLAAGFGVWMFRIDRIATRLESKFDDVKEWRAETSDRISGHTEKLEAHADRLTRLETRLPDLKRQP